MNRDVIAPDCGDPLSYLPTKLLSVLERQPYPLLFATVSGAHLYGFPSPDSDWDIRGIHILPLEQVLGLRSPQDTLSCARQEERFELDLVTHDIKKFFGLLLKRNGYVLEQVMSPLSIATLPEFEELQALIPGCLTKFHSYHYLGFAHNQWQQLCKREPKRVKPLLYVYRVLLTGIHLMRSGRVEANLVTLNSDYCLPAIDELIRLKMESTETATLSERDIEAHRQVFAELCTTLEQAATNSHLPAEPTAKDALNDLLVRVRLHYGDLYSNGRAS